MLGPAGYAPQLAAVLSDNNHAFVMWTDEPPPGQRRHGHDLPRAFRRQRHLPAAAGARDVRRARAGSGWRPAAIALVRMTPSEGVLAAWTSWRLAATTSSRRPA